VTVSDVGINAAVERSNELIDLLFVNYTMYDILGSVFQRIYPTEQELLSIKRDLQRDEISLSSGFTLPRAAISH